MFHINTKLVGKNANRAVTLLPRLNYHPLCFANYGFFSVVTCIMLMYEIFVAWVLLRLSFVVLCRRLI